MTSTHDTTDDALYAPIEWKRSGDYRDISYDTAEGIAKITICRPEVRNAFRPQTLFELSTRSRRAATTRGRRDRAHRRRATWRSARAATSASAATTATSVTTTWPSTASAASTCSTCRSRSGALPEAGRRDGRRLRDRRRPRAPRRLRPHDRRRQRPLRSDRAEGRVVRRRLRLGPPRPHRRPEEGPRDLVPVRASTTRRQALDMGSSTPSCRSPISRARPSRGAARCWSSRRSPCG